MSRASQDWETPPGPMDVHPWSEELQALLEEHSVQEELAAFVVDKFDRDLCREQFWILSTEELLCVASLCSEVGSDNTIFWNNKTGKMESVQAPSLIEAMEKVADVIYNQELSERGDEAIDALLDAGTPDACVDAAAEIFMRIKYTHKHKLDPKATTASGLVDGNHKLDTDTHVFFYEQDFYVLSNFSAFSLIWKNIRFDTSEAAYHWEKFTRPIAGQHAIRNEILLSPSAHEAFKIAERNKALRRDDWDDVKVGIMREILTAKADQHEYVRRKLLATGDRILVEDSWRDDYWGWGPNRDGQNMLGKLWMEVRENLRREVAIGSEVGG